MICEGAADARNFIELLANSSEIEEKNFFISLIHSSNKKKIFFYVSFR